MLKPFGGTTLRGSQGSEGSVECFVSCCPLFSTDAAETPGINSNHPQPTSNPGQKTFRCLSRKPFKEQLSRRRVNPPLQTPPPRVHPPIPPPPSSAPMCVCRRPMRSLGKARSRARLVAGLRHRCIGPPGFLKSGAPFRRRSSFPPREGPQ